MCIDVDSHFLGGLDCQYRTAVCVCVVYITIERLLVIKPVKARDMGLRDKCHRRAPLPHHAHTQGGSFGDRSPVTATDGAARQVPPSRPSPAPRTYTGRLLRRSLARHSNRRGSATSATVAPLSRTTHIDRAAPSEIARPSQQHTGQRDNSTTSATVALLPRVRVSLLTCASRAPRVA